MNLEVVTLLVSSPLVLWGLIDSEISALKAALADGKAALADGKAALADGRSALVAALADGRSALADSRSALADSRSALAAALATQARALALTQALATSDYAALQHSLDVARGLLSVRAVLEQIAFDFSAQAKSPRAARRSTTEALSDFCRQPAFVAYLDAVSRATQIKADKIAAAADSAYSLLSASIHNGVASASYADVHVPSDVFPNAVTMVAVSAIFKFSRRDVRLYVHSSDVPALPSPARTPPQSAPASAAASAETSAAPTAASSPSKDAV